MTPNIPPEEKKLSHTAIRVGIIVSGLTILTTVWTTVIQPQLTVQRHLELATYRITELEKDIAEIKAEVQQLRENNRKKENEGREMSHKKFPSN